MPGEYLNETALTVTLRPRCYRYSLEEQTSQLFNEMEKYRTLYKFKISLLVEITKNGNIHAHGFISLRKDHPMIAHRTMKIAIINMWRKSNIIGFTCPKPIDTHDGWLAYCNKEREQTAQDVNWIVLFDEHNYFTECFFEELCEECQLHVNGK